MRRFCVRLITVSALLYAVAAHAAPAPTAEAVTIWSDGTRLAGDLWKPAGLGPDERVPAILLVHGWGGVKSHLNQAYAPVFAGEGMIVLTFDYRGWGESDGKLMRLGEKPETDAADMTLEVREVREIVDPIDQLADIRNALAYLSGEAQVDVGRLAIWGSSLGGGLALQIAGEYPHIKVLISQIGAVNSLANFESGDGAFARQAWQRQIRRARGDAPAFPTGAQPGLRGAPDYFAMSRFDPIAWADDVAAATLIIDARDEELFDIARNGAELHRRLAGRVPVRYETLPGQHYDIYRDDGYRQAVALQLEWLRQHLLGD
ncbi:MAG: alpha/beta fold hydrolase [Gammaproteobacteria bacterium]|jgi:dienelactone hydrolase|nr:alpha/beta fold hydrolase [Gammaproteobacteria bacterium]